jgi:hypothetical protein
MTALFAWGRKELAAEALIREVTEEDDHRRREAEEVEKRRKFLRKPHRDDSKRAVKRTPAEPCYIAREKESRH